MPDKSKKKNDVRQMRFLLERIADLAENAEHTGTFAEGATLSVRRYNKIVESLEERDVIPEDMFSELDEDDTNFSTLGAEARLLRDYLEEYSGDGEEAESGEAGEESDEDDRRGRRGRRENRFAEREQRAAERAGRGKGPDFGVLAALAPFLEKNDLHKLLSGHFGSVGRSDAELEFTVQAKEPSMPSIQEIVQLAPFVERATLVELLEGYLSRGGKMDSDTIVHLAPFLPKDYFRPLLHRHFGHWFAKGESESGAPANGDKVVMEAQPGPSGENV